MRRITAELTSGTVVHLADGRHEWRSDEPPEARGTDTGPNPYELLLSSVAACTCITLALYCRHKGIQLDSVRASYTHERVHSDDADGSDQPKTKHIDQISGDVTISGEFSEAQRKRLAEVATRCPVHKTLANGVVFDDAVRFG
jgi:putative redox protein